MRSWDLESSRWQPYKSKTKKNTRKRLACCFPWADFFGRVRRANWFSIPCRNRLCATRVCCPNPMEPGEMAKGKRNLTLFDAALRQLDIDFPQDLFLASLREDPPR